MHRTEGANNVAGMFTDGPPGTALEENWHNAVQEEIISVLTAAGMVPLTAGTDTKDQLVAAIQVLTQTSAGAGSLTRSKFRWKDGDEIYIGAGVYDHRGTRNQTVLWNSELTFQAGPGGSNANSVALDASNWFFLYVDDSAIVTSGSNILTAAEFVMNKTAPTYSHIKHGWYNGADRCIFGNKTDGGSAFLEFIHNGNIVWWADRLVNQTAIDIDDTFTDIGALIIPPFATVGIISGLEAAPAANDWEWRTNGQTGAVGHHWGYLIAGKYANPVMVITDASQIIELKKTVAGAETIAVNTEAWKFPIGM